MTANATGVFGLGSTFNGPTATIDTTNYAGIGLEGREAQFDDVTPATSAGATTRRSDRVKKCLLVRNVSGIALLPKRLVTYQAAYYGKRVDGYCDIDFEFAAGVVDEYLPAAGVRNGDLFWLTTQGPTLAKTSNGADATNVHTEGTPVFALTAANSTATTNSGRVQPFTLTSNLTNAGTWVMNTIGRAMSSKTTANSNVDILVDLTLMP